MQSVSLKELEFDERNATRKNRKSFPNMSVGVGLQLLLMKTRQAGLRSSENFIQPCLKGIYHGLGKYPECPYQSYRHSCHL